MDPNETLRVINGFLARHETGEDVDVWCQDLYDWLKKGGFELGTSYYRCRKVHHDKGERV